MLSTVSWERFAACKNVFVHKMNKYLKFKVETFIEKTMIFVKGTRIL